MTKRLRYYQELTPQSFEPALTRTWAVTKDNAKEAKEETRIHNEVDRHGGLFWAMSSENLMQDWKHQEEEEGYTLTKVITTGGVNGVEILGTLFPGAVFNTELFKVGSRSILLRVDNSTEETVGKKLSDYNSYRKGQNSKVPFLALQTSEGYSLLKSWKPPKKKEPSRRAYHPPPLHELP